MMKKILGVIFVICYVFVEVDSMFCSDERLLCRKFVGRSVLNEFLESKPTKGNILKYGNEVADFRKQFMPSYPFMKQYKDLSFFSRMEKLCREHFDPFLESVGNLNSFGNDDGEEIEVIRANWDGVKEAIKAIKDHLGEYTYYNDKNHMKDIYRYIEKKSEEFAGWVREYYETG